MSASRLQAILAYLKGLPRKEIKRLWRQKRDGYDCQFLDVETNRCSVYQLRPPVCQVFGYAPGLQCPHATGPVLVKIMSFAEARAKMEAEADVALISTEFRWKDLL